MRRFFNTLNLTSHLKSKTVALGFESATAIQRASFSAVETGADCLIVSGTGTGKTLSYILPLLSILEKSNATGVVHGTILNKYQKLAPSVLIVIPNHELATQIQSTIASLHPKFLKKVGKSTHSMILPPSEGTPLSKLATPHIIITTPKQLHDFLNLSKPVGAKNLNQFMINCKSVVVDECELVVNEMESIFDRNAFRGFKRELIHTPSRLLLEDTTSDIVLSKKDAFRTHLVKDVERQFIFVSATLGTKDARKSTLSIIEKYFDCQHIVLESANTLPASLIERYRLVEHEEELSNQKKSRALVDTIKEATLDKQQTFLVFVNSAHEAKDLCSLLSKDIALSDSCDVDCLYAQLYPLEKQTIVQKYTSFDSNETKSKVLICTDGSAYGIDFNADYVIHYDKPLNRRVYIHRCGRVARAGRSGISIGFVENGNEIWI